MKLTTRARYGIRLKLDIAEGGFEERPVRLSEDSERTGISRRYLDQVVMPLKGAGLLMGVKGRRGGYQLARPADQIRLGDIVEATIGPVTLVDCVGTPGFCRRSAGCSCHLIYRLLSAGIRVALHDYTLADLSNPARLEEIRGAVQRLEAQLV
ncbi:MAG: Rrf2 family transcriptional regulator [Polyangia bacterium]|jgi:Rrf2 family protein|nr:Rrf2 family transcriptional regulator [Polyangia bacterium]